MARLGHFDSILGLFPEKSSFLIPSIPLVAPKNNWNKDGVAGDMNKTVHKWFQLEQWDHIPGIEL